MNISMDFHGTYTENKEFFDAMAISMQKNGHRVGMITGERELDVYDGHSIKEEILNNLGFKPDFLHMWGQTETIANGYLWKAKKMDIENVDIHFDDDALGIKHFTGRRVMKFFTNDELKRLSGVPEQQ